jgi:hypothetical protein
LLVNFDRVAPRKASVDRGAERTAMLQLRQMLAFSCTEVAAVAILVT